MIEKPVITMGLNNPFLGVHRGVGSLPRFISPIQVNAANGHLIAEPPKTFRSPITRPTWEPLVIPAEKIDKGEFSHKTIPYSVDLIRGKTSDGEKVVTIRELLVKGKSHVLKRVRDKYVELQQPVFFSQRGPLICCYRNDIYYEYELPRRLSKPILKSSKSSVLIMMHQINPPVFGPPPDGILLCKKHGIADPLIHFNGILYPFLPHSRRQGEWWYSFDVKSETAIRFREGPGEPQEVRQWPDSAYLFPNEEKGFYRVDELYEVEPFPQEAHRFPETDPVLLRDSEGEIWEVLLGDQDKTHYVATSFNKEDFENFHYKGFKDDGTGIEPIDLSEVVHLLKLNHYPNPLQVWSSLMTDHNPVLRSTKEVEVDVANWDRWYVDRRKLPEILPHLQYNFDLAEHIISIQVPRPVELSRSEIQLLLDVLRTMPQKLRERGKSIAFSDKTPMPRFLKGGQIVLPYPWNYKSKKELRHDLYHEFAHGFAYDTSPEYSRKLEAAVAVAASVDIASGFKVTKRWKEKGAKRNWQEFLSVAFEDFHKAGPTTQQLILNSLINPEWNPK